MDNLSQHLTFVKEQEAYHEKLSRKFEAQPWRRDIHFSTAEKFRQLANYLVQSDNNGGQRRRQALDNLTLTPEEVEGLPPELVNELSISDADKLEFIIIAALRDAGGILNLDRILIALFRKTGEVFKRNTTTSKLYRMIQKGLIYPVSGRKGVYSIDEIETKEGDDLLTPFEASTVNAANTPSTAGTRDAPAPPP